MQERFIEWKEPSTGVRRFTCRICGVDLGERKAKDHLKSTCHARDLRPTERVPDLESDDPKPPKQARLCTAEVEDGSSSEQSPSEHTPDTPSSDGDQADPANVGTLITPRISAA
jgi:hypothetical protein